MIAQRLNYAQKLLESLIPILFVFLVLVRVEIPGELLEGVLDLRPGCIRLDAEELIIICVIREFPPAKLRG
jgi:hypothetical protein